MEPASDHTNETIRLLHERSSCRSFHDRPIPADVLETILAAGVHAPTGGNLQPYSIIKIADTVVKEKLTRLCGDQPFIATAPIDLLFCIDYHRLGRWARLSTAPYTATSSFRHFWIAFQDTIIAAQNICTAADAVGLGSVYVGTVLECFRELREMSALPDGVFPVVLLCLGYPKARPQPKPKLGTGVVVHDEQYRELPDDELLDAFAQKYPGPGRMSQLTDERLERLETAARTAHGAAFGAKCVERAKTDGVINAAQTYFGLHYCADTMPVGNDDYLKIIEDFGFGWLRRFEPSDE